MIETMIYSLGLNALWQAGVLGLGVVLAIRAFKITAPKIRAALWSAAFFASAIAPLAAFMPGAAIEAPAMTVSSAATASLAAPVSEFAIGGAETSTMVISYSDLLAPLAALVWIGGIAFGLFRLVEGGAAIAFLRGAAKPVDGNAPGVPASIKLRSHDTLAAPLATGILRPVIILPQEMADDLVAPATQHALAHELAHIKRGDLVANFAEQIVLCVFWWNPVMHAMRTSIAENREMACDDHAVSVTCDANDYAHAIIECVERATSKNQQQTRAHALSVTGRPSSMTKRITRLLADNYSASEKLRPMSAVMTGAVMLASAAMIVVATPRIALAQPADDNTAAQRTDAQLLGQSLVEAIVEDDRAQAEALVTAGADINVVLEKDGTALIAAVNNESLSLAAWLIALGADVDQYALYDETALISAVRTGNVDMVRLLIEAGADVNLAAPTQTGEIRSPMGEARRMKRDDLIDLLMASGASE